jgi:hypothetical protein
MVRRLGKNDDKCRDMRNQSIALWSYIQKTLTQTPEQAKGSTLPKYIQSGRRRGDANDGYQTPYNAVNRTINRAE